MKLRQELTKNFDGKKRLKGAAIAVQTVKYLGGNRPSTISKPRLTKSQELLLQINNNQSFRSSVSRSQEARIDTAKSICKDCVSRPERHVSSPEILSPTKDTKYFFEGMITGVENLNSQGEFVRKQNPDTAFVRSDHSRKPVKRKVAKNKTRTSKKTKDKNISNSIRDEHVLTAGSGKGDRDSTQKESNLSSLKLGITPKDIDLTGYTTEDIPCESARYTMVCIPNESVGYTKDFIPGESGLKCEDSLPLCVRDSDNVLLLYGAVESETFSKLSSELEQLTGELYTQQEDAIFEEEDDNEYY